MNAKSFNLSTQGASHIKKNKECQDASLSYFDEEIAIAIVCDGHGGDDYMRSAYGSQLGCAAAEKNIKSFLASITKEQFFENPEKHLKNLEASIISLWNEGVNNHLKAHPFSEAELSGVSEKAKTRYSQGERIESAYGTTMIAVAMTHEFWFGIHIGDGKCVAVNPEGKFVQPIPWDSKCFLNATTSMCDSDALERFRHFYSEKLPVAVFVGSDGIDDCFKNNEQLHNLYKTILYSFGTEDFEKAQADLKDYLPRLSAKGSGDDVSIAAMFDFDLVPELDVVKDFDREKEKARVEENARLEAEKNEAERKRLEEEHAKFQREKNGSSKKASQPQKVAEAKFCTECGAKLVAGMKFCGECGAKIVAVPGHIEKPQTSDDIQIINLNNYGKDGKDEEASEKLKEQETSETIIEEDVISEEMKDGVTAEVANEASESEQQSIINDEEENCLQNPVIESGVKDDTDAVVDEVEIISEEETVIAVETDSISSNKIESLEDVSLPIENGSTDENSLDEEIKSESTNND